MADGTRARDAERLLVIGIGNLDRGDDGAGRVLARRLSALRPAGVDIIEHGGEATSLLALIENRDSVILVDACRSGAGPGTVQCFDISAAPLPNANFAVSTHGLGVAEGLELARALGRLPRHCIVYAIEGDAFEPGTDPSPAVLEAIEGLCARLLETRTKHLA